jgi:hypothetical protein
MKGFPTTCDISHSRRNSLRLTVHKGGYPEGRSSLIKHLFSDLYLRIEAIDILCVYLSPTYLV